MIRMAAGVFNRSEMVEDVMGQGRDFNYRPGSLKYRWLYVLLFFNFGKQINKDIEG